MDNSSPIENQTISITPDKKILSQYSKALPDNLFVGEKRLAFEKIYANTFQVPPPEFIPAIYSALENHRKISNADGSTTHFFDFTDLANVPIDPGSENADIANNADTLLSRVVESTLSKSPKHFYDDEASLNSIAIKMSKVLAPNSDQPSTIFMEKIGLAQNLELKDGQKIDIVTRKISPLRFYEDDKNPLKPKIGERLLLVITTPPENTKK